MTGLNLPSRGFLRARGRTSGGANNGSSGLVETVATIQTILPFPMLSIARNAAAISLSWSSAETELVLQESERLGPYEAWSDTTSAISTTGLTHVVEQFLSTPTRFSRLRRP